MPIEHVQNSNVAGIRQLSDTIAASKKIVVITGAGISTSCGIPDFRSKDGLYSLIASEYQASAASNPTEPAHVSGRDLFDANLWKSETSTAIFYKFIASLRRKMREGNIKPSSTHRFLATLRDRRKMLRTYTQNIDGLEEDVGLETNMAAGKGSRRRFVKKVVDSSADAPKSTPGTDLYGGCEVVQLHGELKTLRCTLCMKETGWGAGNEHQSTFLDGKAPICEVCAGKDRDRRDRGCRGISQGSLRPNVVLYGEEHPMADLVSPIVDNDIKAAPDLLLIFGTSLKVHGLKVLVKQFANAVHATRGGKGKVIFVNRTEPAASTWKNYIDFWVESECDGFVSRIRKNRPDLFNLQTAIRSAIVKNTASTLKTSKKRNISSLENSDDKENGLTPETAAAYPTPSPTPKRRRTDILTNTPSKRTPTKALREHGKLFAKTTPLSPTSQQNSQSRLVNDIPDDTIHTDGETIVVTPCRQTSSPKKRKWSATKVGDQVDALERGSKDIPSLNQPEMRTRRKPTSGFSIFEDSDTASLQQAVVRIPSSLQ